MEADPVAVVRHLRQRVDRERLIEAAAEIANRDGLDGLSMTALATALGVRTPSLYSHVEGIADVKRLLALYGLALIEEQLTRAALGKAAEDAARAMFHAHRAFATGNPGVYAATLPTPPAEDREWNEAKDCVAATILTALEGYGFSRIEKIHAMRGLRSLAHGFASLEMSGALKNPVDRQESYDWLISIFLAGLEKQSQKNRLQRKGRPK
jgi:AcrR family transcriptional regulator